MENYIELNRVFAPVTLNQENDYSEDWSSFYSERNCLNWDELLTEYRCVILAEAGAGKTEELKSQALKLSANDQYSFFIRIEDIDSEFEDAFEVGDDISFQAWLQSEDEAWFFLDSVDEARLKDSNYFKKAIDKFAKKIRNAKQRTHLFISSRPFAWRSSEDQELLNSKLFLPERLQNSNENTTNDKETSCLKVVSLQPLDRNRVKQFCSARNTNNIDELVSQIEKLNLWYLAERPFDLESIILKWNDTKSLGSRIDLLKHNITSKLTERHSVERTESQTITLEQALIGARRLAAAVVLTEESGILVPGANLNSIGIRANEVLVDWNSKDTRALLELGIFNDIVYDSVRFRHREVRELLAAEWFDSMLKAGRDSESIKSLFFRNKYGVDIISSKLRPVLSWLILFDNEFYDLACSFAPELALEGGDPAILPLPTRKLLLDKILNEIDSEKASYESRNNASIARIAAPDLAEHVSNLVNQYKDNDEVIFFLGRLAWQGGMNSTADLFEDIALDPSRGVYARIAAVRAIVTLEPQSEVTNLWKTLNSDKGNFEPQLLTEFLDEIEPSQSVAEQLVTSVKKLKLEKSKSKYFGFKRSLSDFISKLSVDTDIEVFNTLLEGFSALLSKEPYQDKRYCRVSQEYSWLVSYCAQILEIVVISRNELALSQSSLEMLVSIPLAKGWVSTEFDDYKDNLKEHVPSWTKLNDALYWVSIDLQKKQLKEHGKTLVDDWTCYCHGCFWNFDEKSCLRLLSNLKNIAFIDDQLVLLSTIIRVYQQSGKPPSVLNALKEATAKNEFWLGYLQSKLGPRVTVKDKTELRLDASEKKRKLRELSDEHQRQNWIDSLINYPTRIRKQPDGPNITNDVYWLFTEINGDGISQNRIGGADWQKLEPIFGSSVAIEYKDALTDFWRRYDVKLQSEQEEYNTSESGLLLLAMAGLEIESNEAINFPENLNPKELKQALRYLAKELNGFPSWLESTFKVFPVEVIEAFKTEVLWELDKNTGNQTVNYIVHDVLYYAPWIHDKIAPIILDWLMGNPKKSSSFPEYCIEIVKSGGMQKEELELLAKQELAVDHDVQTKSKWFALWIDCNAESSLPVLKTWLASIDDEDAKKAAQVFVVSLMGDRRSSRQNANNYSSFLTPNLLKELYILAHRYIDSKEDINRADGGVYTPELRDDAQAARDALFTKLCNIEGKEAYIAIKELEESHPNYNSRKWMKIQANKRAESDGDLNTWTNEQVYQFEKLQFITPKSHQQLYEVGVRKLSNMKAWLELGNDSPWKTWQRAEQENEIRNLVTGWLNQNCREQYTTAQEPELANDQRMDIWLHSNHVKSPVPIELKMLDKGWSGNKLCERLRNQLVGDYIKESGASCGIMLLVSAKTDQNWVIEGKKANLKQLRGALLGYWETISNDYPNVSNIDVIVVDLNMRSHVCNT